MYSLLLRPPKVQNREILHLHSLGKEETAMTLCNADYSLQQKITKHTYVLVGNNGKDVSNNFEMTFIECFLCTIYVLFQMHHLIYCSKEIK